MQEIAAIPISKILGGMPSDDGKYLLLKTATPDNGDIVLAFPGDELPGLVQLAALGRTQGLKIQGVASEHREVHNTTWWELSKDPQTGLVILSLTLQAGGRLDFALPGLMPRQMHETLGVLLDQPTAQPPHGTRLS